jgi:hypothetical protein
MIYPHDSLSTVSIRDLVELCGVDITTARRWRKGSNLPPPYVLKYVNAKITRDLSFLDPAWKGWMLAHGKLESPEGWQMTMGDVMLSRLRDAQIRSYQGRLDDLRAKLKKAEAMLSQARTFRMEEQPTPDEWDVQILTS